MINYQLRIEAGIEGFKDLGIEKTNSPQRRKERKVSGPFLLDILFIIIIINTCY